MASSLINEEKHDHNPARSGTPSAWKALIIVAGLMLAVIFFDTLVCGVLRFALAGIAWSKRTELSIDHLSWRENGTIQAQGVALRFGSREHRSSWKSDWVEVQLPTLGRLLGFSKEQDTHYIRSIFLGRSKFLLDRRTKDNGGPADTSAVPSADKALVGYSIPWMKFLPDTLTVWPFDLVVVGNNYRVAISNLSISLPDRWAGRVAYSEAVLDLGSTHHVFTAASATANWNGTTLLLGNLELVRELKIEEFTLTPLRNRVEFGLRGSAGAGLLRGDGSLGITGDQSSVSATLVGENLSMGTLAMLIKKGDQRASGTIRQGRITFRGDPSRPLESDSAVRLVADDFRWEGRGWDSLRLSATLTGRLCRLSELRLRQKENEVEARGESKLPEDWHKALRAPFIASFHADLDDAGALAALAGPEFAQLSGALLLEGAVKGAENKAEGYCNLMSPGMKIRRLPVDWLKGCLLFEGEKTRLSNLEIWSGKDRVMMEGSVENSLPHTYAATARFAVGNLTKSLALLEITTAAQIGGGAAQGGWTGDGSAKGHSGTFQAKLNDWLSPWTTAGMSGNFEGSYSPGRLYCSKAEFQAQDLRLGLQFAASPTRVEAKSIVATRKGKPDLLLQGSASLPINGLALWQSGDLISTLGMKEALALQLDLNGIKFEELANLLGQKTPFTGTLEGKISASGTPENPEVHSVLKASKLTLPDATANMDVTWNFDAKGGRAMTQLIQNPTQAPPLMLQAEIPFRLTTDNGTLRLAEPTATIHAVVSMHHVPVSGWLPLMSGLPLVVRDGVVDGSLNLEGTLSQPSVKGTIDLTAREAWFQGLTPLNTLELPIECTISKASISSGNAFLGTNPVTLGGELDWRGSPLLARLDLAGKDLAFPALGGVESRGDAAISVQSRGTNVTALNGTLIIRKLSGALPSLGTPTFIPPGILLNRLFDFTPVFENTTTATLDLQVKTDGMLPLMTPLGAGSTQIQADIQLQGVCNDPRWKGTIVAKDMELALPAGRFGIPTATVQSDGTSEQSCAFKAYGLTHQGFCTIQTDTATRNIWIEAPGSSTGITEGDMILALGTPEKSGRAGTPAIDQLTAWIRQQMLFPLPPVGWIGRREEQATAGSLGFYGSPWAISTRLPAGCSPSAAIPTATKN